MKPQPFDPNRTQASDPHRTQAMTAPPTASDPDRTTAFAQPKTVDVRVTPSREATIANGPAREQFLIEVEGGSIGALPGAGVSAQRTPLNLCLVIDRSGSMEGRPLEFAKQACAYVVDMLAPNDVLSIVLFEETVEVLMAPQRVTQKQVVKDGISRIQPGNTTNLYDGMVLGAQQLLQTAESTRATRMVVLSDGEPTAGITEFSALVQHAGQIKAQGITCTFLGLGEDYNEELLAQMAKKAGGNYYYIREPQLIAEVFRAELDKLVTLAASNLRLSVKLARWVSLRAATGQSHLTGEREVVLPLADLERGATIQQVLDLEMTNHPLGWYRVAEVRLSYDDAASGRSETTPIDLVMEFTADAARYMAPPNPTVAAASEVAAMSRTVEKTILGLKTQQISSAQAVAELQKTQAMLLSQGRTGEAREVTLALRALQSGDQSGAEKTLMGTMVQLDQGKKSP